MAGGAAGGAAAVNNVPWLSVLPVPLAGAVLVIRVTTPVGADSPSGPVALLSVLTLAVSIVVAAEFKPSAEPKQLSKAFLGYRRSAPHTSWCGRHRSGAGVADRWC